MAVLEYRLGRVEKDQASASRRLGEFSHDLEVLREVQGRHTEQISGEGGLQNAIKAVRFEMASLRTAFYGLTAAIIAGTVALLGAILSHAL